jgi:hypothetical protein
VEPYKPTARELAQAAAYKKEQEKKHAKHIEKAGVIEAIDPNAFVVSPESTLTVEQVTYIQGQVKEAEKLLLPAVQANDPVNGRLISVWLYQHNLPMNAKNIVKASLAQVDALIWKVKPVIAKRVEDMNYTERQAHDTKETEDWGARIKAHEERNAKTAKDERNLKLVEGIIRATVIDNRGQVDRTETEKVQIALVDLVKHLGRADTDALVVTIREASEAIMAAHEARRQYSQAEVGKDAASSILEAAIQKHLSC